MRYVLIVFKNHFSNMLNQYQLLSFKRGIGKKQYAPQTMTLAIYYQPPSRVGWATGFLPAEDDHC